MENFKICNSIKRKLEWTLISHYCFAHFLLVAHPFTHTSTLLPISILGLSWSKAQKNTLSVWEFLIKNSYSWPASNRLQVCWNLKPWGQLGGAWATRGPLAVHLMTPAWQVSNTVYTPCDPRKNAKNCFTTFQASKACWPTLVLVVLIGFKRSMSTADYLLKNQL